MLAPSHKPTESLTFGSTSLVTDYGLFCLLVCFCMGCPCWLRGHLLKWATGDSSDASISHLFCGPKWATHVRWGQQWSHCGPLFVRHLPKDIWTHHLLSFFSGPLLAGTKGSGRLTVESHSPSRCSLAAWQGDKEEAEEAPTVQKKLSALCWKRGEVKGSSYAHVGVPAGPQSSPRVQILEERQGIKAASEIRKQRAGWRWRPARFIILCITATEEAMLSFSITNSWKVLLIAIYRCFYQINVRQWFSGMKMMLVISLFTIKVQQHGLIQY